MVEDDDLLLSYLNIDIFENRYTYRLSISTKKNKKNNSLIAKLDINFLNDIIPPDSAIANQGITVLEI